MQHGIDTTNPPLDVEQVLALAPTKLKSYRLTRYDGRQVSVSLDDFDASDRHDIERAYVVIRRLQQLLSPIYDDEEVARQALERFLVQEGWKEPFQKLAKLNVSIEGSGDRARGKVAHDLKGGALTALYGVLQFVDSGSFQPDDVTQCYFLARDHSKIMRNGLPDLDPERYEDDLEYNLHDVELIGQKWRGSRTRDDDSTVEIIAEMHYQGSIATRCMEFSALDRVLYNLVNNAVHHTCGETVFMSAVPVPNGDPTSLRFVIANAIDGAQRRAITRQVDGRPTRLFDSGVTTKSTGLGLAICTEFVAHAYGLAEAQDALEGGYLGATLTDERFVSWFHWPLVDD